MSYPARSLRIQAYCHGRGGGDLGNSWYDAGRLYDKHNAVRDYLACAEAIHRGDLQAAGSKHGDVLDDDDDEKRVFLVGRAFSAGGVVVGAATNAAPHLFQAVSLTNPFLDVVGTMSSEGSYLTEHEWDEFGNPVDDPRAGVAIRGYCPFWNLGKGVGVGAGGAYRYPPVFLVGTLDDENVPFWNPVCFGMKMRDVKRGRFVEEGRGGEEEEEHSGVLLHVEEEGGHDLQGKQLDVAELETCFVLGRYARWKKDMVALDMS